MLGLRGRLLAFGGGIWQGKGRLGGQRRFPRWFGECKSEYRDEISLCLRCVCCLFGWAYPFFFDGGAVRAYDELLSCCCEIGQTADGEIFVVDSGIIVDGVISLNGWVVSKINKAQGVQQRNHPIR